MNDFVFDCLGARAEPYAAAPTLVFRLRISESSGRRIRAIALRCQLRIEPIQRHYSDAEAIRLAGLFGERARWGDTLKPLQLAVLPVMVPAFTGSIEIEVPLPCSYDLEVASGQYFHALDDGEIPLLMLFSGTVFTADGIVQIPWDRECGHRMPVAVWRDLMEMYFPGGGWLRLTRETLDALQEFKHRQAIPTWDAAVTALLKEAPVDEL
ncbi:MAG: hypothetical protein QOE54_786 [Streptosporangiaceae bacterium]|jgi:hypothetical protein|nr:hypothetical protein [Streptosporangiaceae bacterium]MDX6428420.1 hypothetical protein [Streptosporangiaceae bacterium]